MTLDGSSAHPDLIISRNLKTVSLDFVLQSEEPTDHKRFYPLRCVLGSPGLERGCHSWKVTLQGLEGGGCVVGVVSDLVPRRGMLAIEPSAGFWVLRITGSECQAIAEFGLLEDLPVLAPRKVGVYVDHELGEVTFYNAITGHHIYTFHTSFPGRVFPFFQLLLSGTRLTLSP